MVPNFEIELTAAIISFNKIWHHLELWFLTSREGF
jgi:hypothetical protein